jgi:hypothetical protein
MSTIGKCEEEDEKEEEEEEEDIHPDIQKRRRQNHAMSY